MLEYLGKRIKKNQLITIFGRLSNIHKFNENQTKYLYQKIFNFLFVVFNATFSNISSEPVISENLNMGNS